MDYSLVQAMGLYDFRSRQYWDEWLEYLGIPRELLPAPCPTIHDYGVLFVTDQEGNTAEVPVLAMIGDQQAALFGYDCHSIGDAECTHGTASFVNVFLGGEAPAHENLNVYFAWHLGDHRAISNDPSNYRGPTYCLEADTTVSGAALRWMRENARFLDREDEIGTLAATVPDSGGVMFVPAFTGLNVPYNLPQARGSLLGLTLGSSRAQIARAFLDSIGYQIRAILETIKRDTNLNVERLKVGGGLAASDLACQIQANWLGIQVIRPEFTQTSARAAALLAGMADGNWNSLTNLPTLPGNRTIFEPQISSDEREAGYERWKKAIRAVNYWSLMETGDSANFFDRSDGKG
jgi:glycerol kinase